MQYIKHSSRAKHKKHRQSSKSKWLRQKKEMQDTRQKARLIVQSKSAWNVNLNVKRNATNKKEDAQSKKPCMQKVVFFLMELLLLI